MRSRNPKSGGITDLHGQWRAECTAIGIGAVDSVPANTVRSDGGRLSGGGDELASRVFAELHEQRSWWTRANIAGEVARLIQNPTVEAVAVETGRIAGMCVGLEADADDEYADVNASRMTSQTILDAEARVLAATVETTAVKVPTVRDEMLGDDQYAAVENLTTGELRLSTIVGPAGAGKTTMLRSVAESYAAGGTPITVLCLSANAARVVTDETGLPADTIASWQHKHVDIPRDGLVIVDEASMVPTLVLDDLVRVSGVY